MKILLYSMLIVVLLITNSNSMYAQSNETELIQETRKMSNKALRNFDHNQYFSFLSEDVLTAAGNGTLICGLENLKKFVSNTAGDKMYWIRTPDEIDVNAKRGLAWEKGQWKGYSLTTGEREIIKGNYAAMWTKETGSWKIKSELFVAMD